MIDLSGDTWTQWRNRHQDLAAARKWDLAGLFCGHEGSNFRAAGRKVLYTGNATAGPFEPTPDDQDFFGCNRKAFWSFARRLNSLTGGNSDELENIAWSNLCKIGTRYGNPGDDLVEAQADLAIATLRQEWTELNPTLIVCVAEGYQEHLIYRAFEVIQNINDGFNVVTTSSGKFWVRSALNGMPAFLWMKHPQGKPREYIETAQSLAEQILAR